MIRRLVILLLLFVAAWGSTLVGQERYAVTANTLNVRSGPGTYYSVVYKLHKGDVVEVIGQNGQWATIRGAGGRYYVNSRYLSYVGPVQKQKSPAPKKESGWDKLYRVVKVILEILAIVAAIGLFVSNAISGLALWMLIICGIGALVGWMTLITVQRALSSRWDWRYSSEGISFIRAPAIRIPADGPMHRVSSIGFGSWSRFRSLCSIGCSSGSPNHGGR